MNGIRALSIMAVLAAILMFLPILIEPVSADPESEEGQQVVLSGNIVAEEDMIYPDGTNIVVTDGTTIDLNQHRFSLGEGGSIVVQGDMTVSCSGGSIYLGPKCFLFVCDLIFPELTIGVEYTFLGHITVENIPISEGGAVMKLVPVGDDHYLHATWENTTVDLEDPLLNFKVSLQGAEIRVAYSSIRVTEREYSKGELIQVTTTTAIPNDPDDALDFYVDLDGVHFTNADVCELHSVIVHEGTGIIDRCDILGISEIELTQTEQYTLIVKVSAEQAVLYRESDGKIDSTTTFSNIDLEMEVDEGVIAEDLMELLIDHKLVGNGNALKRLHLTAESEITMDSTGMIVSELTDIVLNINGDGSSLYYMVFTCNDGDDVFEVSCDQAVIHAFGLTSDMRMDLDAVIPKTVVKKTSGDSIVFWASSDDTGLILENFGVMTLYTIYARTGSVTIQEIMDNCDQAELSSSELAIDYNGDDDVDADFKGFRVLLCVNTRGMNTLTFSADEAAVDGPYEDGYGEIDAEGISVYMEASGSVTECLDAFTTGINFTTDVHADIQVNFSKIAVHYTKDQSTLSIVSEPVSSVSPASMLVSLTLEHSMYSGKTTVDGDISTVGYELILSTHRDFTDPVGSQDIVVRTHDLSGSFRPVYGEKIELAVDLHTDWTMDFKHYDIQFRLDVPDSNISLNHGALDVKGYDSRSEGMLAVIHDLTDHDFTFETRVSLGSKALYIYRGSEGVLFNAFIDPDVDARKIMVELVRDDHRLVTLDRFELSLVHLDGSSYDRPIDHLDIYTDLSGNPKEPTVLEKYADYLLWIFVAISCLLIVILIYYRIKRPELFRFTE